MTKHYHFIGIGGTGLSAMARILVEKGQMVSGSDAKSNLMTAELQAIGATIFTGHSAKNISGADMVIRSSAIKDDNVEVSAAISQSIPVIKRREFLSQLIDNQECLAVAGTHGKTTTTAILSHLLISLGEDPSFIVGSPIKNININARYGKGKWFVIEADEYDNMFLGLHPKIAVITYLEHDHPDCFPTMEEYRMAFTRFISNIQPNGTVILCADDDQTTSLLAEIPLHAQILTYGMNPNADLQAKNIVPLKNDGSSFDVFFHSQLQGKETMNVNIKIPGKHNVKNALGAIAVMQTLGFDPKSYLKPLSLFESTSRRFEIIGEKKGITFIDDYAHHPTEIKATIEAARQRYPGRPLFAVWQPHTYTRTKLLQNEFFSAFSDVDHLIVTDVFAAREVNPEFSMSQFATRLECSDVTYASSLSLAENLLAEKLKPNDVVIVLSAGDADIINTNLLRRFSERTKAHGD